MPTTITHPQRRSVRGPVATLRPSILWAALLVALLPAAASAQYAAYRMPGVSVFGWGGALNAFGLVATSQGAWNPLTASSVTRLTDLGGQASDRAYGVSDAGHVVGYRPDGSQSAGFRTDLDGNFQLLGHLSTRNTTRAIGVNASGEVVGYSAEENGSARAFLYTDADGMQPIGPPLVGRGFTTAYQITNGGQVVGQGTGPVSGQTEALRWNSTDGMQFLGGLPGAPVSSIGFGIAANGTVVGRGTDADLKTVAVRWSAGSGLTSLGFLAPTVENRSSVAHGANSAGLAVGVSTNALGSSEAVVWDAAGAISTLALFTGLDDRWLFTDARAVNERGDILARGMALDGSGFSGWVLLHDPTGSSGTPVPEPSALVLLAIGALALWFARRRQPDVPILHRRVVPLQVDRSR